MRSFPLKNIWFKTVKGTELEKFNWDEIAEILIEKGLISLVAEPGHDAFTRYKLNHSKLNCTRAETHSVILEVLRRELPRKFGEKT